MISLTTPALLFPAVSLLFLSYTNRFLALSALVRKLYHDWEQHGNSDEVLMAQIRNLSRRLTLIRLMQISGAISLFLAVISMVAIISDMPEAGLPLFVSALIALGVSLIALIWECIASGSALRIMLDNTNHEL